MNDRPTLDVLICTLGPDGIRRVAEMPLPEMDGVRYIVSWQMSGTDVPPPVLSSRKDIEIHRADSRGLSANRNNALACSRADIMLIADDDLRYTPEGITSVIDAFAGHPDVDIGLFRYTGADAKYYPEGCRRIGFPLPKGYYLTSFEIAIRRCAATEGLRFDPRFGLGAPVFGSGEELLFVREAIKRGANVTMFPTVITEHPGMTTGTRMTSSAAVQRAEGLVIALLNPLTAPLRIPLKAWRMHRQGAPLLPALLRLTEGAFRRLFIKL